MNKEDDIKLQLELQQLEGTIEYAKFRCIPTSELIQKLSEYEVGDFTYDYFGRLNEIELSNDDYSLLIYSVDKLISKYKNLPTKDKTKFENFIRRLIVYLPSHLTHKYFDIFIRPLS